MQHGLEGEVIGNHDHLLKNARQAMRQRHSRHVDEFHATGVPLHAQCEGGCINRW